MATLGIGGEHRNRRWKQSLWEGGPVGTLFRGPTATEEPETEGTFECLVLTNS